MPSHAPDGFITLGSKPLMTQELGIEIVDLEGTMMHVLWGIGVIGAHEEGMVIDELVAAVDVCEYGHVSLVFLWWGSCSGGGGRGIVLFHDVKPV